MYIMTCTVLYRTAVQVQGTGNVRNSCIFKNIIFFFFYTCTHDVFLQLYPPGTLCTYRYRNTYACIINILFFYR